MNAVIMSFDPNEKQSAIYERKLAMKRVRVVESDSMKRVRVVESDSVKSARKAKDKLHKACERASEIRERTSHREEPWII